MIEEIFFDNRTDEIISDDTYDEISNAIKHAITFFEFEKGYQVSVSIVNRQEIKILNNEFRNVDNQTDVLSFPMEELDPRGIDILGDIVLCLDVAKDQAIEFGHSYQRELTYLTVHSILHLLGYDHMNEDDKTEMRYMEKKIMKSLGIFKSEVIKVDEAIKKELIEKAIAMKDMAYCPYSQYKVGAALYTKSGKIYTGCNIENASFSATICAERTAAVKAVSEGEKEFVMIAIAVSGTDFGYPCGVCRQFLNEFAVDDFIVIVINNNGDVKEEKFTDILPYGFKAKDMN